MLQEFHYEGIAPAMRASVFKSTSNYVELWELEGSKYQVSFVRDSVEVAALDVESREAGMAVLTLCQ